MYRCRCGAFLTETPTFTTLHREKEQCNGVPVVLGGVIGRRNPVDRAIVLIKGEDALGHKYRAARPLAPCNEREGRHAPHTYVESQWYYHVRTCSRCGHKNRMWATWDWESDAGEEDADAVSTESST